MLDVKEIKITESNAKKFFQDNGYSDELLSNSVLPCFCVKFPCFPDSETISDFYKEIISRCIICFISIANKIRTDLNSENNGSDSAETNVIKNKTHAGEYNQTYSNQRSASQRNIKRKRKTVNTLCPFTMNSTYNITRNDEKIISLYTDQVVMNEKTPIFYKRTAQTWLTDKQRLMSLSETASILNIKGKIKKGNDFFVTDNGIVVFRNIFEEPKGRVRQSQYENLFLELTEIV